MPLSGQAALCRSSGSLTSSTPFGGERGLDHSHPTLSLDGSKAPQSAQACFSQAAPAATWTLPWGYTGRVRQGEHTGQGVSGCAASFEKVDGVKAESLENTLPRDISCDRDPGGAPWLQSPQQVRRKTSDAIADQPKADPSRSPPRRQQQRDPSYSLMTWRHTDTLIGCKWTILAN